MPVGPSYWLRCRSKRSMSVWSVAVPTRETGWRCTTSASSAPRVMTSPVPVSSAMPAIWWVKVRQRSWGSMPSTSTTSPPGVDAEYASFVGHEMRRVWPSTRWTWGRVDWKS